MGMWHSRVNKDEVKEVNEAVDGIRKDKNWEQKFNEDVDQTLGFMMDTAKKVVNIQSDKPKISRSNDEIVKKAVGDLVDMMASEIPEGASWTKEKLLTDLETNYKKTIEAHSDLIYLPAQVKDQLEEEYKKHINKNFGKVTRQHVTNACNMTKDAEDFGGVTALKRRIVRIKTKWRRSIGSSTLQTSAATTGSTSRAALSTMHFEAVAVMQISTIAFVAGLALVWCVRRRRRDHRRLSANDAPILPKYGSTADDCGEEEC
ncbi:unnamed protein product [Amoebophrya sp. A25]|nr:unnamed protein product [Amoebophrya sp. A25]|eukprot:GSA25T00019371001.1